MSFCFDFLSLSLRFLVFLLSFESFEFLSFEFLSLSFLVFILF